MKERPIFEMSEEAAVMKVANNLPFAEIPIGKSIFINFGELEEQKVRSLASCAGKKLKLKFRVVKHEKLKVYEIANVSPPPKIEFAVGPSSPQARDQKDIIIKGGRKYPFFELKEGFSFTVPIGYTDPKTLDVLCCQNSVKYGRKFIMITHAYHGIHEVACLHKVAPTFYPNSPEAIEKGK